MKKQINMRKEVKRYGDGFIIRFSAEEVRLYNINENTIVDISDIVFTKRVNQKKEFVLPDSDSEEEQKSGNDFNNWNDKYVHKPVVINLRKKDGNILKFNATKIVKKKFDKKVLAKPKKTSRKNKSAGLY